VVGGERGFFTDKMDLARRELKTLGREGGCYGHN